jgi:hypothetical protein
MQSFHDEDEPAGDGAAAATERKLDTDLGTRDQLGQEE